MWPELEPEPEVDPRTLVRTAGGNSAFHNFHNDFSHILNPNERRRLALAEIDKIPFGWYHVRAVAVAGAGFFADSYDLFAINLALQMIGIVFWQDNKGNVPTNIQVAIKAATSGGAVIGQIVFGWLADVVGRKKMYGVELIILIVATLGQALASGSNAVSVSGLIIFERVIMGLGLGGDYPMSAIITSEFAPTRWRGTMIAAVFSMQGGGQFAAAIVALITTAGFREAFSSAESPATCLGACQLAADRSWRIIIGVGALPALFALYYRITIPETPRFTFDVAQNVGKAERDIKTYLGAEASDHVYDISSALPTPSFSQPRMSWSDFIAYFSQWRHGSVLLATMSSWFLLDLAFYGLGLNNATVLAVIGFSSDSNVYEILYDTAVGNLVLVCAGAIPGYWVSVLTIDYFGRRPIQIGGFAILTLIFCVIGFGYNSLNKASLLALYILAQFFFNFGPNATTFIVPGECFPTRYRSTAHGLSAASGKIGATIAQIMAPPLLGLGATADCKGSACSPWLDHLMEIFAFFMLLGMIVSFLIPETNRRTLEDLAGEEVAQEGARRESWRRGGWAGRIDKWFEPYWRWMGRGWDGGNNVTVNGKVVKKTKSEEGLVAEARSHGNGHGHRRSESQLSKGHHEPGMIQLQDVGGLAR